MRVRKNEKKRERSIHYQINKALVAVVGAALPVIITLAVILINTTHQYSQILTNANTAADFNLAFKENIDSAMYNHVIRPRGEDNVSSLPLQDLDDAVDVLKRLELTTKLPDNQWRIRSMLNWCENLRVYMLEIASTERYDDRMELLDRNIRGETGLTRLIDTYMHSYLDAEVREMARVQESLRKRTLLLVVFTVAGGTLLTFIGIIYSMMTSRNIAASIRSLSEKVSSFGEGNLSPASLNSSVIELNTLSDGFDEMATRLDVLMKKQIENERSLHKAELELLQAQINPHFLYNTLDSIAILAESEREEDAVRMVNSLSSFFRISLSKGKDIISLGSEISHVKSYLEIQQIRYSDILKYRIDVPEELLRHMTPKLILQPLVENALYHGIKNRRGVGNITITGSMSDGCILLKVSDDGAGMDEQQINALRSGVYEDRHTGLGLVNVHKRIRMYCGDGYGLQFESRKDKGTVVTVRLPADFTVERGDV